MPPRYFFKSSEIIKDGKISEDEINQLKKLCADQKLPPLSDEQIILFYLSANNIAEDAQTIVQKYFKYRNKAPELFFDMDMEADDMLKASKVFDVAVIPARTPQNEAIIFGRLNDTSYSNFHLDKMVKMAFMSIEYILYKSPPNGLIAVIDMKGVGIMHLTKIRIGVIQKFFQYIQEAMPCQIKQVHFLNTVSFIDKILLIIKPFIKKELFDALNFHSGGADMEKIFASVNLPKSCIPEDYSGNLSQMKILTDKTYREMTKLKTFYSELEKQVKSFDD